MVLSAVTDICGELLLEIIDNNQIFLYFQQKMTRYFSLSCLLCIIVETFLAIS